MKQNLLNKVWLRVCMIVAVVTTAFAGTAWAEDEVYKTALFGNDYNSRKVQRTGGTTTNQAWTATNGDFTVTLLYFCNANSNSTCWNYVATGGSKADYNANITTSAPIDRPITKVAVNVSSLTNASLVSDFKLYTSSDYSNWREIGDFTKAAGEQIVAIPNPSANLFYRIVVNTTGGQANNVQITKVEYYKEKDDPNAVATPVINGDKEFTGSQDVTITCATSGATIKYSTDSGVTWNTYAGAITVTEPTTIRAKAVKTGMTESHEVSKSFFPANLKEDVTWDLTAAPTGTTSIDLVTWTETFAVMSLARGGSTTEVNANLPNNYREYTQFAASHIWMVSPLAGYTIVSVEITATSNDYATVLGNSSWTNATATVDGVKVTVTPTDGTLALSASISSTTRVTGVKVEYAPVSLPYIAGADVSATNLATSGTIEVAYNRVDRANAAVALCDADHNAVAEGTYDWITVGLNSNKDITYTLTANNTGATRTAYIHIYVTGVAEAFITVTQTQAGAQTVKITAVGYGTLYYSNLNLIVPEGVTAYTYKVGTQLEVSHTYAAGEVIPAGTGVVVKGNAGTYGFTATDATGTADPNNMLRGSDEAATTTGGSKYYGLSLRKGSNDPETVGFYWMADNGGAFVNGAHKAYLAVPAAATVKSFFIFDDEDDPTGIEDVNLNLNDNEAIYNVAGQRLSKMQKGINIVNGKKILR